jgi:hypothetical protein
MRGDAPPVDYPDDVEYDPYPAPVVARTYAPAVPSPADIDLCVDDLARRRARQVPAAAAALTAGVGTAAWGCAELATMAGQPVIAGGIVLGTWAGTALSLPVLRAWFSNSIPAHWNRRWWLNAAGGALWVDAVAAGAAAGPTATLWLFGGGAVAAAIASVRWMDEHQVPHPRDLTAPEPLLELEPAPGPEAEPEDDLPPEIPLDAAEILFRRWEERVAAGSKVVLRGAMLTGREVLPNAVAWLIETDGDFTYDEISKAHARIAARLGVSGRNVIIEPIEDDESQARLTIVTLDVLRDGVIFERPKYLIDGDDHLIPLAFAADGTGWLHHVAVDEVGVRPALIVGEPGSGKTATLEAIQMARLHSGIWRPLFADGDPAGGSSPLLNAIIPGAGAGPEAARRVVEALEDIIEIRSRLKPTLTEDADGNLVTITDPARQRAVREIRPCRQYPGYVGVFDEYHRLTNDPWLKERNFAARCERILRIGRKYGVTLDVATQSLLAGDYGNSTNLRSYLAARNAWIHRSGNKSERHSINGVSMAPGALPQQPGYAFAAGSGRLCLSRVAWSKTMGDHAAHFPPCPGDRLSELAVARHQAQELDATAALEDQLRLVAEWETAMRADAIPPQLAAPTPVARPAAAGQPAPARRWSAGGVSIPDPSLVGAKVIPMHARTAPPPADPGPLHWKAKRILGELAAADGPMTADDLKRATGLSGPDVSKYGGELIRRNLAHRPGAGKQGSYAAGPAPVAAANALR